MLGSWARRRSQPMLKSISSRIRGDPCRTRPPPTTTSRFFEEHGWLVVDDAIDPADLDDARATAATRSSSSKRDAWPSTGRGRRAQARDEREFKILQSSPTHVLARAQRRAVPHVGGRVRLGADAAEPSSSGTTSSSPSRPQTSAPTLLAPGRGLLGPQPRRPGHHVLDAVPRRRRAQRLHALHRRRPPRRRARAPPARRACRATCCYCEPDESRTVACPIALGSVTFHHSKTPAHDHAPTRPTRGARILTQHLQRRRASRARATTTRGRSTSTSSPASAIVPDTPMTEPRRPERALEAGRPPWRRRAARGRPRAGDALRRSRRRRARAAARRDRAASSSPGSASPASSAPSWPPRSRAPARRRSSCTPPTRCTATPAWSRRRRRSSPSRSRASTAEVVRVRRMVAGARHPGRSR